MIQSNWLDPIDWNQSIGRVWGGAWGRVWGSVWGRVWGGVWGRAKDLGCLAGWASTGTSPQPQPVRGNSLQRMGLTEVERTNDVYIRRKRQRC